MAHIASATALDVNVYPIIGIVKPMYPPDQVDLQAPPGVVYGVITGVEGRGRLTFLMQSIGNALFVHVSPT